MGLILGTLGYLGLCVSGSALWGAMMVFPTRGHCGSRTSRGSQSVLQLGGLSEDQTFGGHLLGPNCVPLVSKGERSNTKSCGIVSQGSFMYFPFKNKQRYF